MTDSLMHSEYVFKTITADKNIKLKSITDDGARRGTEKEEKLPPDNKAKKSITESIKRDSVGSSKKGRTAEKMLSVKISLTSVFKKVNLVEKTSSLVAVATPRTVPQRVFLYIQMKEIQNLPNKEHPLEVHLSHEKGETLVKLQDTYNTEPVIYQREFHVNTPTFTLTIDQDSMADMNLFSDNPLMITLYEHVPKLRRDSLTSESDSAEYLNGNSAEEYEGDFEEEHLKMVGAGFLDLLQLFQHKRLLNSVNIYLYPPYDPKNPEEKLCTARSVWEFYSILPIMKECTFENLVFITLESIYNLDEDILHDCEDIIVELSFTPNEQNAKGEYEKFPICNFKGLITDTICHQSLSIVWENIKRHHIPMKVISSVQMETGSKINLARLFRNLFCTDGIDFGFGNIDKFEDEVLVSNSMHRYVLDNYLCQILEHIILVDRYKLILELYRENQPNNILMQGIIDPSIFCYPNVNSARFAVHLNKLKKPDAKQPQKSVDSKPPFAIIKICFYLPITQENGPLDIINEDPKNIGKLKRCGPIDVPSPPQQENSETVNEIYRCFDQYVTDIVAYIVNNEIKSIKDDKGYFCCQLANLENILLTCCGCDFNVRYPTKDNVEFRHLMTIMYKELMERIYGKIKCDKEGMLQFLINYEMVQSEIIETIDKYKLLHETGATERADYLYKMIREKCPNSGILNFYIFLYNTEKRRFEESKSYISQPIENKDWEGQYFAHLVEMHMNYMLQLRDVETENKALENLIDDLTCFADKYQFDREARMLLYCIYKMHGYEPGMSYMRWKFENLYELPHKELAFAPRSLWGLYLDYDLNFETIRAQKFHRVFKLFLRLGLYKFAEIIFVELQSLCTELESYMIKTTFNILQGTLDERFVVQNFYTDNTEMGQLLGGYLAQVNGNVEYYRGNMKKAKEFYLKTIAINSQLASRQLRLSYIRLAHMSYESKEYELAIKAYKRFCILEEFCFISTFGIGKCLYYLGRYVEALEYFNDCSAYQIHIPDTWGYMAVINLKLHKNFFALESWKMAKLYPTQKISDDIYDELEKINYKDVDLFVDVPK